MTLAVSSLDSGVHASVSSFSTASVSAASGSLLALWVADAVVNGASVSGISGGSGLSWTQQASRQPGGPPYTLELWTAIVPSGGLSGALTVSFSSAVDAANYDLDVATGAASGPVGQVVAADGTTDPSSLSFSAVVASKYLFGCLIEDAENQTTTESPAWTALANNHQSAVRALGLMTQVSPDTSVTAAGSDWSGSPSGRWCAIGFRLTAA